MFIDLQSAQYRADMMIDASGIRSPRVAEIEEGGDCGLIANG